jgi:peroxiredoxin
MQECLLSDPEKLAETADEAFALASALQRGLSEKLATYLELSKRLQPDSAAAYARLVDRLGALDGEMIGPAIGDRMPDFLLPDQRGQLISLESLLALGPIVISMNRGHWCHYCRLDLRALAGIGPGAWPMGTQFVSIMPEKAQFTKEAIAKNDLPFAILSDIDLGYALLLGMIYWVGPEVSALYEKIGIDLDLFQGNKSHFLPVAGKFIVGRDGVVKAREVNVDFRQRMETTEIIAALARL